MAEAGPPFALYEPSADEIHSAAADIERHAGDVENLNSATSGAQNQAVVSVVGLLELPMMATLDNAKAAASSVLQSCVVAGAACRRWGMMVASYNSRIEDLNQRWETELANDFGAERVELPTGALPEDQAAATADFEAEKDEKRAALESELRMLQQQYETELETSATDVAGALEPGAASEATLQSLYEGGALSAAMAPAFPQVDYVTGTNPRARWMNLVAGGAIPEELWDMSADDIRDYLLLNPERAEELVPAFALLLGLDPLQPQERVFLEALGAYDAHRVANTLAAWTPSRDSLGRIEQGTDRLREINARLAFGGTLTDGDKRYMHGWYNGVGADNLAALPQHVDEVFNHDPLFGTPQGQALLQEGVAEGDEYFRRLRSYYLSPVADGIMHLSNPDVGGTDRLATMPEAIRELVATEIGYFGPDNILRSQREGWTELGESPGWGSGRNPYSPDPEAFTVAGLDRYTGFADLMNASTVLGGAEFTADLGRSAIRVQQDLHTIAATADLEMMSDEERALLLDATTSDAPNTMLTVVGRNPSGSAELLLDDEHLPALLAMPSNDDTGVIDVIMAGTDPDPSGEGRTQRHAEATLALFLEVAGDRDGYLERMTDGVTDAVVHAGINWIDTFARTPMGTSADDTALHGSIAALPEADGELSILLTDDAQRLFLEFIAGTGTDVTTTGTDLDLDGGARFGSAIDLYSVKLIGDALRTGDAATINNAMRSAATLNGSFDAATYEYAMDQTHDRLLAAQEAALARQRRVALYGNMIAGGATSGFWSIWLNLPLPEFPKTVGSALVSVALTGSFRGVDRIAGVGEPAPIISEMDEESGAWFEWFRREAANSWNHTLLDSAHLAGIDPTQEASGSQEHQEITSLYESDGDGVRYNEFGIPQMRPYPELRDDDVLGGVYMDRLETAVDRSFAAVDVADGTGDVRRDEFHETWTEYNSTNYHNRPSPTWIDDAAARELLYGEHNLRFDNTNSRYAWLPTNDPYEQLTRHRAGD